MRLLGVKFSRLSGVLKATNRSCCLALGQRTASNLAAAFDHVGKVQAHASQRTGLFGVSELSDSSGFKILEDRVEKTVEKLKILARKTDDPVGIVEIFDGLSNEICKVADLAEFVHLTHSDKGFAEAATATCLGLSGIVEKLNTNEELYNVLKKARAKFDQVPDTTNGVAKRVADLLLFDFEQSGIHLNGAKKKNALDLHNQIKILEMMFVQGTAKSKYIPLDQWPQNVYHNFKTVESRNPHIQVDQVRYDSDDPLLREHSYKLFMASDKEQEEIFNNLLSARNALAKILGFESYAHRCLEGSTVCTPENAMSFLQELFASIKPKVASELDVLRLYKNREQSDTHKDIMIYDMHYYMSNIIYDNYKLSHSVAEYFSLGTCMEGLSMIFGHLFGIELVHCDVKEGELWSEDVRKIGVVHETEGTLGYIYCDLFARQGKIQTESHFTVRGGKVLDNGDYQLPVVCLVCNFPRGRPTLLSPGMVDNLFHEMGHAMHSMLARTRYQHIAGTRCATDFAEVPSIFLEHFSSHPDVLQRISRHYKTGDRLPLDVIHSIIRAKHAFASLDSANQVYYAILDQLFHQPLPVGTSPMDIMTTAHAKYSLLPYVKGTAWHLRIGHFASYGAKYYSYMWSKAVASLVWNQFFVKDPFCRKAGEKYRQTLLAHGSGKQPKEMIEDMLQTELTNSLLVKAYLDDLR